MYVFVFCFSSTVLSCGIWFRIPTAGWTNFHRDCNLAPNLNLNAPLLLSLSTSLSLSLSFAISSPSASCRRNGVGFENLKPIINLAKADDRLHFEEQKTGDRRLQARVWRQETGDRRLVLETSDLRQAKRQFPVFYREYAMDKQTLRCDKKLTLINV